ncbi:hypothetical protein B7P43_G02032, partial [Cryptotermes secundus]
SRHFRNKKREYLKDKIDELAMNSKNKNIRDLYRGINDFKRGYQPVSNLVKDENGDLLADSHNILNRWRNYFSQLLNIDKVNDVRQIEILRTEPLVPDPSPFEVEIAISDLESYKSPGSDQILAKLTQAGSEMLCSKSNKIIISIWNKEELPEQWEESVTPVHKKGDKTHCSNYRGILLLSASYKILSNMLISSLSAYVDETIRNTQCEFRRNRSTTDQIFSFVRYLKKNGV